MTKKTNISKMSGKKMLRMNKRHALWGKWKFHQVVEKAINPELTKVEVIDNITEKMVVKDNPANSIMMKKVVSSNTDLSLREHLQFPLI
jgi:predicted RNA-binding protein